jgi:Ca2+-binding RTX toxin-like protein
VDNLILQGSTDLQGYGNSTTNAVFGNSGVNLLDGGAGADVLTGDAGNDVFMFNVGQGAGDTIVDFAGNGAAMGDSLYFAGYGPGATFTSIDATHWQVNYNGGVSHDIITFMNGAPIHASDYVFM